MTILATQADVTPAVLKVMEQTTDPRLREIMVSLVTHLHAFIRDVKLTRIIHDEAAEVS
jgi:catechol 1,2-dioxygenase